jgi:peptide subunit release factor 1 (eRF1)
MISLGYGKFVRADRVFALVPLEGADRRDGHRTLVYVEGIDSPLVASRSEGAIAADLASSLGSDVPRRRRGGTQEKGQDPLF